VERWNENRSGRAEEEGAARNGTVFGEGIHAQTG